MATKFWRSKLLESNAREVYAIHEAGHAVMAVILGCHIEAQLLEPAGYGANGVCHMFGWLSYEEDLLVTLAGPEAEFLVSGDRYGAWGDHEETHKLTAKRYSRLNRRARRRLKAHGFRSVNQMADRDYDVAYAKIDAMLEQYREAIEELAYRMRYTGWISTNDVLVAMGHDLSYSDVPTEYEYE